MKRVLISLSLIVILGVAVAAGWYFTQPRSPMLAWVPSDTAVFVGYHEPVSMADMPDWMRGIPLDEQALAGLADDFDEPDMGPMFALYTAGLYRYLELQGSGEAAAHFGLPEEMLGAVYTVGGLPVLRVGLDDAIQFRAAVDEIEQRAGVSGAVVDEGEMHVRRYAINERDDDEPGFDLLLASTEAFAVVTVAGPGIDAAVVDEALGRSMPRRSLRRSTLNRLARRHDVQRNGVGFIDHQRLMAGLTGQEDSRLGQMIDALAGALGVEQPVLAGLRDPACAADANAIAALWPRTVTGITEIDREAGRLGQRMVIESRDGETMNDLQRLRGHVPALVQGEGIFGFGVGMDVSALVPVSESLLGRFAAADFSCPALTQMQAQATHVQPGQLGMVTGLFDDVKGFGSLITAIHPHPDNGQVDMDGVFAVVTERPQNLWMLVQSFAGEGLPADLQPGDRPVRLQLPEMPGDQPARVRVAMEENALIFLLGDAVMPARAVAESPLAPNGAQAWHYDLSRAFEFFGDEIVSDLQAYGDDPAAESAEARALAQDFIEQVRALGLRISVTTDYTDDGIRTDVVMQGSTAD